MEEFKFAEGGIGEGRNSECGHVDGDKSDGYYRT